jgi:LysR family transcriptional regulator, transcription activator of glutamate synthase operon
MDLRQLGYLIAVADELHFTRAAKREHVAQPALSQQIRRLEQELGLTLVERTTRKVTLTDAGELLARRARRVLSELDAARAELQELAGIRTGRLTIGAMHTMGPVDLSLPLANFHDMYPGVELVVREESSGELARLLRTDELDLAFLSETESIQREGLTLERLVTEDLVVALAADHRLSRRRRISLEELAEETFISYREGATLRELLLGAARRAGFEPRIGLESNDSHRIRTLVARGLGVAVLPRSDAHAEDVPMAVIRISPTLTRDISIAWRTGRSHAPGAAAFMKLVHLERRAGRSEEAG